MPITHLLLDIEGTTCPVSFVAEVLFPYARERLQEFLAEHAAEPEVVALVRATQARWQTDTTPAACDLLQRSRVIVTSDGMEPADTAARRAALAVMPYLQWLMDHDVKDTALKDLQGRIWAAGYASGAIVAPLFNDAAAALQRWHAQGLVLAVYSSGSVPAQQLLYRHTQAGDLSLLFNHWFDTRSGAKQAASSYQAICSAMACQPEAVLFISDSLAELQAAQQAGLSVLFSDRDGNPGRDSGPFERISDYSRLTISHGTHGP